VKCSYCGGEVVYDSEFSEWVCPACGVVYDSSPIVDDYQYSYPAFVYYAKYRAKRRGEVFYSWLLEATGYAKSMSGVVYSSDCVFETAVKLLHDVYYSERPLPPAEDTAKLAVLAASRLCSEVVSFEKLFSSTRELGRLFRYKSLRKLYIPPSARELALNQVLRAAKCLEERGARVDYSVLELVDKLAGSGRGLRPRTIAVLVLYKAGYSVGDIAECTGVSVHAVRGAVKKYSALF